MSFACPMAQMVRNPPTMQETRVQSLGGEDALEKGTAPTPVFLPGESHGQRSLVGYGPWGRKELDTTEQLILLTCLLMSMIRSVRSLHCYKADSFNEFSCFIHSTNTHWVLGSEQVLGVLRWAADSSAPLPGTPGWGGQSDVEMKNSSFEDSWEGCLCGVSGASYLSPIRLPQINLGLNKAGESFRTGVSVSSFFKELAHWLQSKTSLAPGMVTATSLLASRLEHRLPKFHLVSKAHRTAPWGGTPAQGSSLEDYVGISSAWSVCPGTFQKHTSAGRHVCAYSRCWKDIKRIFFFLKKTESKFSGLSVFFNLTSNLFQEIETVLYTC